MASPNIAQRTARRLVESYATEADLMARRQKEMACRDCEDFLQLGLDAFKWISRFEEEIRSAAYNGKVEIDQNLVGELTALYADWLGPCESAEQRIETQRVAGFVPSNADEFRRLCEQVRGLLEHRQWVEIGRSSHQRRMESESW